MTIETEDFQQIFAKVNEVLDMWKADSIFDKTEPGRALVNIPQLHAKYLYILSNIKLKIRVIDNKIAKLKRLKHDYYTGRLDQATLKKYNWEPVPFIIKSDLQIYMDGDQDLQNLYTIKDAYNNVVEICNFILKELNNRTWQLRSFIDHEKFINGI